MGSGFQVPGFGFRVSGARSGLAHEAELKLGPTDHVARSIVGGVVTYRDLVDAARSIDPGARNPNASSRKDTLPDIRQWRCSASRRAMS